jgi:hypothetical protein
MFRASLAHSPGVNSCIKHSLKLSVTSSVLNCTGCSNDGTQIHPYNSYTDERTSVLHAQEDKKF